MSSIVSFKRELGGYANLEEIKQQAERSWLSSQTMSTEVIDALVFEIEMLQAERKPIQNNERALTCVYCGHMYPPGTPPSNHEALEEHIKTCPSHPLSKALTDIEQLRASLEVVLEEAISDFDRDIIITECQSALLVGVDYEKS